MKSSKMRILASIRTLVFRGSRAHSLGFLQALQLCSFCPSLSYLPSCCWCSKWHLVEPGVWARCPKWQLSWEKENVTGSICCQAMCPLHAGRGREQVGSTSLGKLGSVWVLPEVDQSPGLIWIFLHFWFCFSYICSHFREHKIFASLTGSMNPQVSLICPPTPRGGPAFCDASLFLPKLPQNPLFPTAPSLLLIWLLRSLYINIYKIEREKILFIYIIYFCLLEENSPTSSKPAHSHQGNTIYHTSYNPSQNQMCLTE